MPINISKIKYGHPENSSELKIAKIAKMFNSDQFSGGQYMIFGISIDTQLCVVWFIFMVSFIKYNSL